MTVSISTFLYLLQISSHSHHYSKEEGHSGWEERVEILQAEVEKKNRMLLEVKKHLREAAEREKQLKTISHDSQVRVACGGVSSV